MTQGGKLGSEESSSDPNTDNYTASFQHRFLTNKRHELGGQPEATLQSELAQFRQRIKSPEADSSDLSTKTKIPLSSLERFEILGRVLEVPLLEPSKALQYNTALRKFRQSKYELVSSDYSWVVPTLQEWSSSAQSSLVVINGQFTSRFEMKGLCVDLVQMLQENDMPVLWAMKANAETLEESKEPTIIDLLKYLISQVLQLTQFDATKALISSYSAVFQLATTEDGWFQRLGSVLANLTEIFIVMDVEIANSALGSRKDAPSFWPIKFMKLFQGLKDGNAKTVVKATLISYGTPVAVPESCEALWKDSVMVVRAPQPAAPPTVLQKRLEDIKVGSNSRTVGSVELAEGLRRPNRVEESSVQSSAINFVKLPSSQAYVAPPQPVSFRHFELFDNQKPSMDVSDRADEWFWHLENILYEIVPPSPKTKEDRIKIAILDTGIHMDDRFISFNRRRINYKTFVPEDPNKPEDLVGHGTHAAGLLLKVAKHAEIYVARISKTDDLDDPNQIAQESYLSYFMPKPFLSCTYGYLLEPCKRYCISNAMRRESLCAKCQAIRHAVYDWRVNIISMSFGFSALTKDLECIQKAILCAHSENVVLFAAARNNGGLKKIAYPADQPEVICINSTDGEGNQSHFNPSAEKGSNFSTLGEDVLSSWPRSPPRRMSGTSYATPIAAGIAAIVMDYMAQKSRSWSERDRYVADKIKTSKGISAVFKRHLCDKRGDFQFIVPWKFFNKDGESELDKVILNTLRMV